MKLEGEKTLLRVFLDKFQKLNHRPLYEAIVEMARAERLAGATVLEGIEGFGQSGHVLRDSAWNLSNNREVIIELVDERANLEDFLSRIEPHLSDVIVTFERAHVVRYVSEAKGTV